MKDETIHTLDTAYDAAHRAQAKSTVCSASMLAMIEAMFLNEIKTKDETNNVR